MTPSSFLFHNHVPAGELADCVESIWYAKGQIGYQQEKIAPTGSVVAIFVFGDAIEQTPLNGPAVTSASGLIIGPHDGPITNRPLGKTHAVGIVATPVGCARIFGIDPIQLRGGIFPLFDKWPRARQLRDALLDLSSHTEIAAHLEKVLLSDLGALPNGYEVCKSAIGDMTAKPNCPVADVASGLGTSSGQLDRAFARVVGLSPRTLSNIIRMRKVLEDMDITRDLDWSDIAVANGWYDQAHFIRNFKRHTGVTPTQYVAARKAAYKPEELGNATAFVPET